MGCVRAGSERAEGWKARAGKWGRAYPAQQDHQLGAGFPEGEDVCSVVIVCLFTTSQFYPLPASGDSRQWQLSQRQRKERSKVETIAKLDSQNEIG